MLNENRFLDTFQGHNIRPIVEDGGECGHAVPETSVPSSLMLLGQLDPELHGDGEAGWCGVIGDVFLKDVELAGVVFFMVVEFN